MATINLFVPSAVSVSKDRCFKVKARLIDYDDLDLNDWFMEFTYANHSIISAINKNGFSYCLMPTRPEVGYFQVKARLVKKEDQ